MKHSAQVDCDRAMRTPVDWCTLRHRMACILDERLRNDQLIRLARILALWQQMQSIGLLLASFDTKRMAVACM